MASSPARSPPRTRLVVNGKKYPVFTAMEVKDIPWASVGAEYICECTGKHLTKELCQGHIDAGAKHVVMGAPSKDDTPCSSWASTTASTPLI